MQIIDKNNYVKCGIIHSLLNKRRVKNFLSSGRMEITDYCNVIAITKETEAQAIHEHGDSGALVLSEASTDVTLNEVSVYGIVCQRYVVSTGQTEKTYTDFGISCFV